MTEDFVTYEIAVKLKEKGFNELCLASYRWGKFMPHKKEILGESEYIDEDISISYKSLLRNGEESLGIIAPTISQVLKWMRDEKKVYVLITPYPSIAAKNKIVWAWGINWNSDGVDIRTFSDYDTYISYEEAALAGITWVLDNIILGKKG